MVQDSWWVIAIGACAQILFSSRLIIQWLSSEKQGRVITPVLFWELSLLASVLLFLYGSLRNDFSIMLGQVLTYYIYIRNMQLQGQWSKVYLPLRLLLIFAPVLFIIYSYNNGVYDWRQLFFEKDYSDLLLVLGIVAQILFTLRFVVQWFVSETKGESVLPLGFWGFSFLGSLLILIYAIFRKDLILFVGHASGTFIYFRNLYILRRKKSIKKASF